MSAQRCIRGQHMASSLVSMFVSKARNVIWWTPWCVCSSGSWHHTTWDSVFVLSSLPRDTSSLKTHQEHNSQCNNELIYMYILIFHSCQVVENVQKVQGPRSMLHHRWILRMGFLLECLAGPDNLQQLTFKTVQRVRLT